MWDINLGLSIAIKSTVSGRCGNSFESVIFKLILWIDILSITSEIVLKWMMHNPIDDKSKFFGAKKQNKAHNPDIISYTSRYVNISL